MKACHFCAYQERTQQQVRQKLIELELWDEAIEELIAKLIKENFINEERYAKAFASGKFRQLKWGRLKIKIELKRDGLSEYCIKKGLAEIDENEYLSTIKKLILQKQKSLKEKNELIKKMKIVHYLQGKGFEKDICYQAYEVEK